MTVLFTVQSLFDFFKLVPIEIEVQGQRARLAYENALMTGKVKVNRARIMFIGQDRSGKTSLKKSLLGLPFDPHEQSTDGVEVVPSKFEVDLDQVKNWRHTDGKLGVSLANSLARMVAGTLKKEKERADSRVEMLNLQPAKVTTLTSNIAVMHHGLFPHLIGSNFVTLFYHRFKNRVTIFCAQSYHSANPPDFMTTPCLLKF